MIEELHSVLAAIDESERTTARLRAHRAELVLELRAVGWSLQRIADAVGRTKQTVSQWAAQAEEAGR